jgi:hypothetical protein
MIEPLNPANEASWNTKSSNYRVLSYDEDGY